MPINQERLALEACEKIVSAVTNICSSLDAIEAVNEHINQMATPLDLADYADEISAAVTRNISHCDPATVKNIMVTFAPEIVTRMKAFYSGTPTQQGWAALMATRT